MSNNDDDNELRAGGGDDPFAAADFEDDVGGMDDDFDTGGGGNSLSELFRNSPLFKVGIIFAGLLLIIGIVILFGGDEEQVGGSRVQRGDRIAEAPGEEVSQAYEEAINEYNMNEVERALKEGDSALPVPVGTTRGRLGMEDQGVQAEDPLERWRRIQEERQRIAEQQAPQLPNVDPNAEAVNALTKAMQQQMEAILGSKSIEEMASASITSPDYMDELREAQAEAARAAQEARAATGGSGEEPVQIIVPAGTIEYAQLLIEANSDAPGPVVAQIVSGPLAGSRILGSFSTEEEFLVLNFDTVVVDGVARSTNAVALDPDSTRVGMVTEIDRRYFKRIVLPAAAAFVEGMAGAIADQGNTVVVTGDVAIEQEDELDTNEQLYKGLEEAAGKVSDILDEEGDNTEPMIRVGAGTPMGILFIQPVLEEETNQVLKSQ